MTRRVHFFAVASLVVAAMSMLPGLWLATGWAHILDDLLLAVIAAFALTWYLHRRRRVGPPSVPAAALLLGFLVKLVGVSMTGGNNAAYAADATVAMSLAAALGATVWQLLTTARATGPRVARLRSGDLLIEALRRRGRYGPSSTPSN